MYSSLNSGRVGQAVSFAKLKLSQSQQRYDAGIANRLDIVDVEHNVLAVELARKPAISRDHWCSSGDQQQLVA